jgi:hypothetical protein
MSKVFTIDRVMQYGMLKNNHTKIVGHSTMQGHYIQT